MVILLIVVNLILGVVWYTTKKKQYPYKPPVIETTLESKGDLLVVPMPLSAQGIPGVFLLEDKDFVDLDWMALATGHGVDGLLSLGNWKVKGDLPAEVTAKSELDCMENQPEKCFVYVRLNSQIETPGEYPITIMASYLGQEFDHDFLLQVEG